MPGLKLKWIFPPTSGTYGYFTGGSTAYNSAAIVTTDKITFSSDTTAAATTANLAQARLYAFGVGKAFSKGYVCGGGTDTGAKSQQSQPSTSQQQP